MSKNCVQCGRFVAPTSDVVAKCTKCSSLFHRECAKLSPSGPIPRKWICCPCIKGKGKVATSRIPDTPNHQLPCSPNPSQAAAAVAQAVGNPSMHDDVASSIVAELRLLRSEISCFRGEMAQLNASIIEFNCRVEKMEARLSQLEAQSTSRELGDQDNVQSVISHLQEQLNERDQDLLSNNVEISGLQEIAGENLINLISLVGKKLGVDVDDRDVVSAERVGPRRVSVGSGVGDADGQLRQRPRPVVVRLARRAVRDNLLHAARVRRGADTSGIISDSAPRRFYVNEHLSRMNRQLFYKAREEARKNNWKYVWTKGGRIYIRHTSSAPVHRVRTEADIERFFGSVSI
ncbi:uncharacterized protein LOC120625687 [Pararge aegeria]|uniref:uncharacterized protein LOC120625687 n=1 Tax=Pararge aegeria TaxID=116150 RepID=UPI0019D30403|nr:uncharacterized protein LOC120625687 [Pararge aegeria]